MRAILYIAMFITHVATIYPQHVYIIIHGTWSLENTWYIPGGDFFDALELKAKEQQGSVVPFCWNGKNSIEDREKAAHNLARVIDSYACDIPITLIGHSHGGTVALLSSQFLQKNKIFCLYTLGTPINPAIYPHMDNIDYCYNLFSFEDLIQPVFGMFKREHVSHERIGNIRIVINGKEPNHTDLHHQIIGTWIVDLHTLIRNFGIELSKPGVLYFSHTTAPVYAFDIQRKELLERDHRLSLLILHSLRTSFAIESRIPLTNR